MIGPKKGLIYNRFSAGSSGHSWPTGRNQPNSLTPRYLSKAPNPSSKRPSAP
jgi:hypothetical protein